MGEAKVTIASLQLADKSIKYPHGVIKDVFVKVDIFNFSVNFIILDMEKDHDISIILERAFLAIGRALIDVQRRSIVWVQDEQVIINVLKDIKNPLGFDSRFQVETIDHMLVDSYTYGFSKDPLGFCIVHFWFIREEDPNVEKMVLRHHIFARRYHTLKT